jgi:hypothetical protein
MQRFTSNGYEVIVDENEITFIDRKTWGLGVLMVILGSFAAILVILSVLDTTGKIKIRSDLSGIALPAVAVLLLIIIWVISRTYRTRRDQPAKEIQDILIIDRSSQVLRDRMAKIAAQLADVKARMHIDWWTRGTMRIVVLSWPGGRRAVYRTFGRRRSLNLLTFLKEQGLDAQ